MSVKD